MLKRMKNKIKNWLGDKKAIARNVLVGLLIALAVLVIIVIVIMIMKEKGESAIDFIKNLIRFKR